MASPQYFCKTCGRTMDEEQFYTSKRKDRYPLDGKLTECRKCITRHVDNFDPETYKWILEEVDVPYIEDVWTALLEKHGKNPSKLTGMTILGRYLSTMKLKQYKRYCYDDSARIKEERDAEKRAIMAAQGYTIEEIQAALAKGSMPEKPKYYKTDAELAKEELSMPEVALAEDEDEVSEKRGPGRPRKNAAQPATQESPAISLEPEYFNDDLTEDDKKYLTIKWGKTYKPYEWVQLEKFYQEMMASFDIQTPSHEDYLKLICKTSLKMHQLVDIGDIDGFQKISKVYDGLMKSAKFTAVQNKMENGEFVNAISEFVVLCEREGFIPRYYVDGPQDKVDETLKDLREYNKTLVTEEMNLGNLIEGAIKKLQAEAEKEAMERELGLNLDTGEDDEDLEDILSDKDFEEYYDFLEEESTQDDSIFEEGEK